MDTQGPVIEKESRDTLDDKFGRVLKNKTVTEKQVKIFKTNQDRLVTVIKEQRTSNKQRQKINTFVKYCE